MDDIMWDNLKVKDNPYITYKLTEWKPRDRKPGEPLQFDTKGDLTVAGVTKPIDMVVTLTPEGNKLTATASKELEISDFGMKPPSPSLGLGLIKTADEVKVTFDWVTTRKTQRKPRQRIKRSIEEFVEPARATSAGFLVPGSGDGEVHFPGEVENSTAICKYK